MKKRATIRPFFRLCCGGGIRLQLKFSSENFIAAPARGYKLPIAICNIAPLFESHPRVKQLTLSLADICEKRQNALSGALSFLDVAGGGFEPPTFRL